MEWNNLIEPARRSWQNLSDRERRLALILGGVFAVLLIGIPLILAIQASSALADENEQIQSILDQISRSKEKLQERAQARLAAQQRYAQRAPDLSAFVEEQGQQVGLTVARTQPQPDAEIGSFTRRSVSVDLPNISLRPCMELLTAVENSQYPVTVEAIQISHPQIGEDRFNLRLSVVAFDRKLTGKRSLRGE